MENSPFVKILTIDKSLPTPIYHQMVNSISKAVEQKTLKSGDVCPSINQISRYYKVSRATVEKAFFVLRKMGLVSAFHGKCYYISKEISDNNPLGDTIMFRAVYG